MKSTIKIFAVFAIVLGFAMGAKAQTATPITNSIKGKAEVMAAITVAGTTPLDFKNVTGGNNKTIGFNDAVTGTQTGGETTGVFTVTKGASTKVTLTLALPGNLKNGSNNLKIEDYTGRLRIGTAASPTATASWDLTTTTTPISTDATGNLAFFTASSFLVDLGATVKPISTQADGSYSEDITLSVVYN